MNFNDAMLRTWTRVFQLVLDSLKSIRDRLKWMDEDILDMRDGMEDIQDMLIFRPA